MLERFISLQNFLKIRLLFGYIHQTNSSKRYTYVLQVLYCVAFSTAALYIFLSDKSYAEIGFIRMLLPVKYCVQIIISLCTKEIYFLNYNSGILTVDKLIRYKNVYFDPYASIISISILVVFKHTFDAILNVNYEMSPSCLSESLLKTSNYLCSVPRNVIIEMCWTRMKLIRRKLKKRCENKNVDDKCHAIKKCLYAYKLLLDIYKQTNLMVNITMSLDIVFYFIKTVYFNQLAISHIIKEGFNRQSLYYSFESTFGLYFATSTPLLQELVLNEYDKIKAIMGNELIECEDDNLRNLLQMAVEYIEMRSPKRSLWRILPIDISLVKHFTSATITYIIIIVSFKS